MPTRAFRRGAPRAIALGFAFVIAAACMPPPALATPETIEPSSLPSILAQGSARPRIGLVLGGGGAKGAAHVGVITLLEDMRIPVDCVIGTSMGALVGGTYAAA